MTRMILAWSGGKDSAWALKVLHGRVAGLLTTVWRGAGRVAIHGVRIELVEAQAAAVGLPLVKVLLPHPCTNEEYERAMGESLARARDGGVQSIAFGDLFLEDVRAYRERTVRAAGLEPLFPIWGLETGALAREMLATGLRARLVCVDTRALPAAFAGREFNESLLADLPAGVDPCGERGEFHTFAYAGSMFHAPIAFRDGPTVERDGFAFRDLVP